LHSRWCCM